MSDQEPIDSPPVLDESVFDQLGRVSTATLSTQLYKQGIRQPSLVTLAEYAAWKSSRTDRHTEEARV